MRENEHKILMEKNTIEAEFKRIQNFISEGNKQI